MLISLPTTMRSDHFEAPRFRGAGVSARSRLPWDGGGRVGPVACPRAGAGPTAAAAGPGQGAGVKQVTVDELVESLTMNRLSAGR